MEAERLEREAQEAAKAKEKESSKETSQRIRAVTDALTFKANTDKEEDKSEEDPIKSATLKWGKAPLKDEDSDDMIAENGESGSEEEEDEDSEANGKCNSV